MTTASTSTVYWRPLLNQGTEPERAFCRGVNSHNSAVALLKAVAIVRDTRTLPSQNIECFHQAGLVRITHGRLAIWLDPLGMLDPQVVVNLFPQVCVRIKLVKHNH